MLNKSISLFQKSNQVVQKGWKTSIGNRRNFRTTSIKQCGIVSILQQNGQKFNHQTDLGTLKKSLETIKHRGPDFTGYWISPEGQCALGHVRLSIIDLSPNGNQPMFNVEKNISVTVNGELYGFEDIRKDLQAKGYHFHAQSDSEIAVYLFQEYGMKMTEYLRGEFAITIWDEKNGMLYAIRDRFGIKPLYYTIHHGRIIFASEIKALFAMGVPAKWNAEVIAVGQLFEQASTIYEGIYQVPPGCYIMATPGGCVSVNRYHQLDYFDKSVPDERDLPEIIEGVRSHLLEAVRLRLRADVPVGIYLSGGLDSSSILGMTAHLAGGQKSNITCYSIAFSEQDPTFDEGPVAQRTVKQFGKRHHIIHLTDEMVADVIEKTTYHAELPSANVTIAAKHLLSKAVKQDGTRVVLTGEGSDEIFAGYPNFLIDYLMHSNLSKEEIENIKKDIIEKNPVFRSLANYHNNLEEENITTREIGSIPSFFAQMHQVTSGQSFMKGKYPSSIPYFLATIPDEVKQKMREKWDPLSTSLWINIRTLLYNLLISSFGDRNEMANSIEGRVPFLDHTLVNYVNHLPSKWKLYNWKEKWILREAMKPFVTDELHKRQKQPMLGPPPKRNSKLDDWIDTQLQDIKHLSFVDVDKFHNVLKKLEEGNKDQKSAAGNFKLNYATMVSLQKQFKVQ